MLEEGEISLKDQPELLNILGKICRRFKTIPDSVRIEGSLDGPMSEEYGGGFATVFRGEYRGRPVAIKTVHLYLTSNLEKCFSVRTSYRFLGVLSSLRVCRDSVERWLPGDTFNTRTFYRLSVRLWNTTDSRWYPSG